MKIVGAGWGRTGTTSVAAALEALGAGPCLHMSKMWLHPDVVDAFLRHTAGESIDWTSELAGWQSGTDWPACWAWRELAALFPHAPVLLTVRDPGEWYDSVMATIHPATEPERNLQPPYMRALLTRMWDRDFGGWAAARDRDHAVARYQAHLDSVRAECPADRLVEWHAGDGWKPLCQALNTLAPQIPFPRLNDRAQFVRDDAG